mmetsp:Transcript_89501/g.276848  ORF Transcript_89501/g.276848 Transcript_89501/m.276848 type:complete len:220 (+) Transcript_89501:744-1403(+)
MVSIWNLSCLFSLSAAEFLSRRSSASDMSPSIFNRSSIRCLAWASSSRHAVQPTSWPSSETSVCVARPRPRVGRTNWISAFGKSACTEASLESNTQACTARWCLRGGGGGGSVWQPRALQATWTTCVSASAVLGLRASRAARASAALRDVRSSRQLASSRATWRRSASQGLHPAAERASAMGGVPGGVSTLEATTVSPWERSSAVMAGRADPRHPRAAE